MHEHLDAINGLFETIGAIATWRNVVAIHRDRSVRGVAWTSMAFFAAWGLWNLVYYPSLHQWLSTLGGAFLVAGNLTWVALALKFRQKPGTYFEIKAEGIPSVAKAPASGVVLRVDGQELKGAITDGLPLTVQCGPADSSLKFISR